MELILNATKSGNNSEVFVTKLRAYSLQDVARESQVTQVKKSLE